MGDTPFIKFYPSDFLAGTSGLSPAERGVYITILCLIYEADGRIVRDDSRLSRRCGAPKASFKRTIEALIDEGKLTEENGYLSNRRAEKAIMDRQNRTQNATHAARQKWSAQKGKIQQNQQPNDAGALPEQCAGDASQKPEPEPEYTHSNECDTGKPASNFWDDCLLVLKEGGTPERQARALLGKWCNGHGRGDVKDAVMRARGSPDVVSFIEGILKPKPKELTTRDVLKGMSQNGRI